MATAVIALGSNLGDRLDQMRSGVAGVGKLGRVVAVSSLYETDPVGGPEQDRYLNAVLVLETDLGPEPLLAALQRIEGDSDRVREVRWGPRTLDLDIISFDDRRIDEADIEIPHPRAHERHFVLAPLVEVRPDTVLADGSQAGEAIAAVQDQRVDRWAGDWVTADPSLGREAGYWVAGQVVAFVGWLTAMLAFDRLQVPAVVMAVGIVLTGCGLVQGIAAIRAFGREVTPSPQPRLGSSLVSTGIYRRVRHPMYGAILLAFTGTALAAGSGAALVVTGMVGVFLHAKSSREERILRIVVPGYGEFRRQVTKRFIPFVW